MTTHFDYCWEFAAATMRMATPLIFAATGGLISEKSGVINISLEGQMTVGAFAAALAALSGGVGAPWLGFFAGGSAGMLLAVVLAVSALNFRSNQIVAGAGINMIALAIPPFLSSIYLGNTGSTPSLSVESRMQGETIVMAFIFVALLWSFLRWTRGGLWLQFAGENAEALKASGIDVHKLRWVSVLVSGFLAGLGGASLSIFLASAYTKNMTAGRGFIALAAVILGKWRPVPTLFACILFGFAEAAQMRLQGVPIWDGRPIPVQFMQILPYLVTFVVLAGFVGRIRPPKSIGQI